VVVEICAPVLNSSPCQATGKLDLSAVILNNSPPIPIGRGEWQFYWQQFSWLTQFRIWYLTRPMIYFKPTIGWGKTQYLGKAISPNGFANLRYAHYYWPEAKRLALSIPRHGHKTYSALYVNQELVDAVGQVSRDKQSPNPNMPKKY